MTTAATFDWYISFRDLPLERSTKHASPVSTEKLFEKFGKRIAPDTLIAKVRIWAIIDGQPMQFPKMISGRLAVDDLKEGKEGGTIRVQLYNKKTKMPFNLTLKCQQQIQGAGIRFEDWVSKQSTIRIYPEPVVRAFDPQNSTVLPSDFAHLIKDQLTEKMLCPLISFALEHKLEELLDVAAKYIQDMEVNLVVHMLQRNAAHTSICAFICDQLIAKLQETKDPELWITLFQFSSYNDTATKLKEVCFSLVKTTPAIRKKYEELHSYENLVLLPGALLLPVQYEAKSIGSQTVIDNAERVIKENAIH